MSTMAPPLTQHLLAPADDPLTPRRVWVVQEPLQRVDGVVRPRIGLHTLTCYGHVHYVYHWGAVRDDMALDVATTTAFLQHARTVLQHYTADDWIVPLGNPVLIALATLAATEVTDGRVQLLDWVREQKRYRVATIDDQHSVG